MKYHYTRNPYALANAMLWATAIVAGAMLGAPTFLFIVLLPMLATLSMVTFRVRARSSGVICRD